MAEPLKNIYNNALLDSISASMLDACPTFPVTHFNRILGKESWEDRELKDRFKHVSRCLGECLGDDYSANLDVLREVSPQFSGLAHLFIPDFVEQFGLDYYEESVQALEDFTGQCSSEFAVRPFIKKYPEAMMTQMQLWVKSKDEHVRRLASEGSRSKLPWAMAVPYLSENPKAVISLLTQLRDDPSEYVRRSVANNLNDISKDHPEMVIQIAKSWLGKNQQTDRMVKHACRTLLKKGDTTIMRLFGYGDPSNISINSFDYTERLNIGDKLNFSFGLESTDRILGKVRLEYAIGFLLANGKLSKKVFKITEGDYSENARDFQKAHNFRIITTRRFYTGTHQLHIIVNGVSMAIVDFELTDDVAKL